MRGFNYRLDEMRAAIGLVQLRRLDEENDARRKIVERYRRELDDAPLTIPFGGLRADARPGFHLATVVFESGDLRDAARDALTEARIQTSVHYPPIHRFSAYKQDRLRVGLPRTESVAQRLLTLPLFGHMREEQVEAVVGTLLSTTSRAIT
jgi:dTDP-4-amino-4,6-dideoxygalactose transaminase